MKRKLVFLTLAVLIACEAPNPVTTGREMAPDGTLMDTSRDIPRPYSSVVAGINRGSDACLNRSVNEGTNEETRYSFAFGQNDQMSIWKVRRSDKGASTEVYAVRAVPSDTGTTVWLSGGDASYRSLDVGVLRWANGDSIICPKMPAEISQ